MFHATELTSGIAIGVSAKPKNMSFVHGPKENVLENRREFLEGLDIDYKALVCAKQAHGSNVRHVTQLDAGRGAQDAESAFADTDAFITKTRDLPLAVFTADCLSVFLYDPITPAIGLVHAGWKGTKQGISLKTVKLMSEKFGSEPGIIKVFFGPRLGECCFEVTAEFKDYFASGLSNKNGRLFFDLLQVNKEQLLDVGIREENISTFSQCTSCSNKEYFSFRREGDNAGRQMSVIMLK